MSNILAIADATAALPEIFLAAGAMALLMLGVFSKRNRDRDGQHAGACRFGCHGGPRSGHV